MAFTIRVFEPGDEAAVVRLWHRCGLVVPANDPIDDIATKRSFQPELFLVGTVAEDLVASVMAGFEGHRGWINYLAVDPEHRGRTFGKLLLKHAEEKLRQLGCRKVNLQVRSENSGVLAFYRSAGYSTDDVVSMGKRLIA